MGAELWPLRIRQPSRLWISVIVIAPPNSKGGAGGLTKRVWKSVVTDAIPGAIGVISVSRYVDSMEVFGGSAARPT
jgi:hypothetical protein